MSGNEQHLPAGPASRDGLDPRLKALMAFLLVLSIVAFPEIRWRGIVAVLGIILGLCLLSRLSPLHLIKRSLVIIPFVLVISLFLPFYRGGETMGKLPLLGLEIGRQGVLTLLTVMVKAWLSVMALSWLALTTEFPQLLRGLQSFGLPRTLVSLISFMFRYLFIIGEEARALLRARDSRYFGGFNLRQVKALGYMAGSLFLRSYERGERVYQAMLARGFDGEVRTLASLRWGRRENFSLLFFLPAWAVMVWLAFF